MFLRRLFDYPLASLLHSDNAVVLCQLDPAPLRNLICEIWNRDHRHLVLESSDGSLWLLAATDAIHGGNLIGDARRWGRELGRHFYVKRSDEEFHMPTPSSFMLPDGRVIEVRSVLVRPQNFTCWGLSKLKELPPDYISI